MEVSLKTGGFQSKEAIYSSSDQDYDSGDEKKLQAKPTRRAGIFTHLTLWTEDSFGPNQGGFVESSLVYVVLLWVNEAIKLILVQ